MKSSLAFAGQNTVVDAVGGSGDGTAAGAMGSSSGGSGDGAGPSGGGASASADGASTPSHLITGVATGDVKDAVSLAGHWTEEWDNGATAHAPRNSPVSQAVNAPGNSTLTTMEKGLTLGSLVPGTWGGISGLFLSGYQWNQGRKGEAVVTGLVSVPNLVGLDVAAVVAGVKEAGVLKAALGVGKEGGELSGASRLASEGEATAGGAGKEAGLTNEATNRTKRTVDDLIEGLDSLPNTGGKTTQYSKSGGFDQANADFDALGLKNVREISMPGGGTGRVGELPDGTRVVVRSGSSENRPGFTSQPTLEIQRPDGATKIRY